MMWHDGFGMGGWGGAIGAVIVLAALTLIVVGVALLIRGLSGRPDHGQAGYPQGQPRPGGPAPKSAAVQVLEERYARGEIDQEEFLRRRADLNDMP